jgi:hypothetical protein
MRVKRGVEFSHIYFVVAYFPDFLCVEPHLPSHSVRQEAFWTQPRSGLVNGQAAVLNLDYPRTICIVSSSMR